MSEGMDVFTIKVEINQAALKKLVETGKLKEFMDDFSLEVGNQIKSATMENLAKAAIGKTSIEGTKVSALLYDDGGDYIVVGPHGPHKPRPRPWGELTENQIAVAGSVIARANAAAGMQTKTASM